MANTVSVNELLLRWQELREQGRSVSPEELCADCPEQLEELKRQIEALQSIDQFLGTSLGDAPSVAEPGTLLTMGKAERQSSDQRGDDDSAPGSDAPLVRSRYRPLRLHAKGGLGEVFVARDEELSREVALKRILRPHAQNDDSRRRFLREGEITGSLEHPGVVPVYGLTRDASGRPCYAMRFVRGQTLEEAIARFHGTDKANHSLTLRQLLSRFVAVCNTIAYAHSRGVIHRDLKPPNIMLGDYGETLVIDWGLAKRLDDSQGSAAPGGDGAPAAPTDGHHEGTATGDLLGTPAFMSPEQAVGRPDAVGRASDIYSLGATLYALLTGRSPFRGDTLGELLRKVGQGDFPLPRQLRPDTPRGLEAICLKAMAREPAARYTTALEMAAELEHWLADEPVGAYREPWTGRVRRWLRRHRALTAWAAGLLIAAVAALAIGIVIVNQEKNRTEQEKQRAQRALTAETAAWKRTREALNTLTDDMMEELLGEQPVLSENEKAFLRKVSGFYEQFAAERGEDEESRAVTAEGQFHVAKLRAFLGENESAEEGYRAAVRLYGKLADDFPDAPHYRQNLARSHGNVGNRLRGRGRHAEAEGEYHKALALQEKLADDFPAMPQYRLDLARTHGVLGALLADLSKGAEAEGEYHKALALQEKLADDFPTEPDYRQSLAHSYHGLAVLLSDLGKPTEAEGEYHKALALQEKLADDFPAMPQYRLDLARSHGNLGRLLRDRRDKGVEAERAYSKALTLLEKLVADFPAVPAYRAYLAYHYLGLGILLANLDRAVEAEKAYRQAIARLEKLAGEFSTVPVYRDELAAGYNYLGILLAGRGKDSDAEAAYREALTLREKLASDFPAVPAYRQWLAGSYVNFGNRFLARCQPQAALDWYSKAMPLLQSILAQDARVATARLYLRNAHWGRAQTLGQLGRHTESARDWERSADLDDGRSRSFFCLQHFAALAHAGDHRVAVKAVEELLASSDPKGKTPPSGALLYNAACVFALSAAAAKDDAKLGEQYAARAITLLRQAKAVGFFKDPKRVENYKKDTDLDALRKRDDYQKFAAELADEGKRR